MAVQRVSQLTVLTLALELETELEKVDSYLIVEMEQLGVLLDALHDRLRHRRVEINLGNQFVLLDDLFKVTIRHHDQLFGRGLDLLRYVRLSRVVGSVGARFAIVENFGDFLDAFGLLQVAHNRVYLLDKVRDDGLEE